MASAKTKNIVNPLSERNLEGFSGTKEVLFYVLHVLMQVGQKRGSMVHILLNIEDGFKFIFLVKSHHYEILSN